MLSKRIIPCLDVKNGQVVKGVQFQNHEIVGEVVELAQRYAAEGADELVFYDITASSDRRTVTSDWVEQVARVIDIPFCVAGGIRAVADAEHILHSGADKISINSPALENPRLIGDIAEAFGTQCIVVGIDSKAERRRLVRLSIYRRPRQNPARPPPHPRLDPRGRRPGRRRGGAELHEPGRHAPGL